MYRSMTHGRPLVNGYSGHTPQHYSLLTTSLMRGDPGPLTLLRRRPATGGDHPSPVDQDEEWRALVERAGVCARGVRNRPRLSRSTTSAGAEARDWPGAAGHFDQERGRHCRTRSWVSAGVRAAHRQPALAPRRDRHGFTRRNVRDGTRSGRKPGRAGPAPSRSRRRSRISGSCAMTIPLPDVRARFVRISTVPLSGRP